MKLYSAGELLKLRQRARGADTRPLAELEKYATKVVREANRRLSALERNNYRRYSYLAAVDWIEREYGEGARRYQLSDDPSDLYRAALAATDFIKHKTSTVRAQRAAERQRINTMREVLGLPKYAFQKGYVNNEQIKSFLNFLGVPEVRKFLEGLSPERYKAIVDDLRNGFYSSELGEEVLRKLFALWEKTENLLGQTDVPVYFDTILDALREGEISDELRKYLDTLQ